MVSLASGIRCRNCDGLANGRPQDAIRRVFVWQGVGATLLGTSARGVLDYSHLWRYGGGVVVELNGGPGAGGSCLPPQ